MEKLVTVGQVANIKEMTVFDDGTTLKSSTRGFNMSVLMNRYGFTPSHAPSISGVMHTKISNEKGKPAIVFGVKGSKRSSRGDYKYFSLEKAYPDQLTMFKELVKIKDDLITIKTLGVFSKYQLRRNKSARTGSQWFTEIESFFVD